MPDILHDFPIRGPAKRVFRAVSTPGGQTPGGLDAWWTIRSSGQATNGAEYELWFGPQYDWRAFVSRCKPDEEFELEITRAAEDWMGTRVGFHLTEREGTTQVRFWHAGWPEMNEHYR